MLTILFYLSLITFSLLAYLRFRNEDRAVSIYQEEYVLAYRDLQKLRQQKQEVSLMQDNLRRQEIHQEYSKDIGLFIIHANKDTENKVKAKRKSSDLLSTPLIDDKIA